MLFRSGKPDTTPPAPQALLALPGRASKEIRLLVANTAFSTDRDGPGPFGPGTLTLLTLHIDDATSPGEVLVSSKESIDLELPGYDPATDTGLNPTALVHLSAAGPNGEVAVICSGVNYGTTSTGDDDGRVIILDSEGMTVTDRLEVGGSPGSVVKRTDSVGGEKRTTLYLAGPTGIRSVQRNSTGWSREVRKEYDAGAGAALPFLSDLAIMKDILYASDFANNRVLAFKVEEDGSLSSVIEEQATSHGPVSLLTHREQ